MEELAGKMLGWWKKCFQGKKDEEPAFLGSGCIAWQAGDIPPIPASSREKSQDV